MTDPRFEAVVLTAIISNSVLMAVEDYEDPGKLIGKPTFRNQLVRYWYRSAPPLCAITRLEERQFIADSDTNTRCVS